MILDALAQLDPGTGETLTQTRMSANSYALPRPTRNGYDPGSGVSALEDLVGVFTTKTAPAGATASATVELQVVDTALPLTTVAASTSTSYPAATDICTTAAAHGLATGMPVIVTGGGGAAELVRGTTYYVIKLTATTFSLALSLANALAGTAIDVTADATGTLTITPQAQAEVAGVTGGSAASDTLTVPAHGLTTGLPVQVRIGAATLTGVTALLTHYVIRVDDDTVALATTPALAYLGTKVDITTYTDANLVIALYCPARVLGSSGPTFRDALAAGAIVPVKLNHRPVQGLGSNVSVARPLGNRLWGRFVVSTALTAGKFEVDLTRGYHGGLAAYPTSFTVV